MQSLNELADNSARGLGKKNERYGWAQQLVIRI